VGELRILIVDDSPRVRRTIREVVSDRSPAVQPDLDRETHSNEENAMSRSCSPAQRTLTTLLVVLLWAGIAPPAAAQSWDAVPSGRLAYLSAVDDVTAWGVAKDSTVWRTKDGGATWVQVPGGLTMVSALSWDVAWGVNANGHIFRTNNGGAGWQQVSGGLKYVSAVSWDVAWGVNANDNIFRTKDGGAAWQQVPGGLKQVSAVSYDLAWGVNANGNIFRTKDGGAAWPQVPGGLKHVSARSWEIAWGVNANDLIFRTKDGGSWQQLPSALKQISALSYEKAWGVNAGDMIYRWGGGSAAAKPAVFAFTDIPKSSWMTAGAATLGPMQLNKTAIPGAHDAGTYAIDTSFTSWTTADLAGDVSDTDRATKWHGANLGVTAAWAKTQTRTMSQMLEDGIRYFDIRVCVDAKGSLRTCHTLYGAPLSEMLSAVKTFTEANPKEIVLLGFNHFWDESYPGVRSGTEGLTDANWAALRTLIKGTLSGKLVSRAKYAPTSTFNQLWNGKATDGSTNQVIALFTRSVSNSFKTADPLFWQEGATPEATVAPESGGTWVSKTDIDEFKSATAAVVASEAGGSYASVFWTIRTIVTPNGTVITRGFAGGPFPKTVLELAAQTNSVVTSWIKNEWSGYGKGNINLIWADGYDRDEIVKLALWLNKLIPQNTPFAADGGGTTPVRTSWFNWNCPTGYRDDGLTCFKPEPKGRGAGYPWKIGDQVGSLDEARARCAQQNPQGCEKAGEIIYPKCPSGYSPFGSNVCSPTCPTGMGDGGIFCTKLAESGTKPSAGTPTATLTSYTRPVGTPLVCPSGKVQSGALCYDACPSGYTLVAGVCWQQCPSGYPDAGATCGKPAAYGRGAGYPWKIGDDLGSLDEARARCRKANPQGCEKVGEIIYPKCRSGFRAIGSNICSPVCPSGMTDAGAFCTKRTETRAPTPLSACPAGKVNENQLCYEPCKTGYTGIATTCKPFN
jgi:hypothetical protein